MNATVLPDDPSSLAELDPETLGALSVQRRPDRPPIIIKLIALFVPRAEADLSTAQEALARRDIEAVRECAHSLKGASMQIGALAFAAKAKIAEECARSGDHDGAAVAVCEMLEGFSLVRGALERVVAEIGTA